MLALRSYQDWYWRTRVSMYSSGSRIAPERIGLRNYVWATDFVSGCTILSRFGAQKRDRTAIRACNRAPVA
jgi:hypothetical protein